MALEPDIVTRVRSDFGMESEQALDLLQECSKTGRIARCIVVASRGSLSLLKDLIRLADSDWRDAIVAGEYDTAQRHVRDLRASFLLDAPEKFWAGEVACMMQSRGYTLAWIATRVATAVPFVHAADRAEGRARFVGPEGEIEVEKRGRVWSVRCNLEDLERHDMNRGFDDESMFRDAVSSFILSRRAAADGGRRRDRE